MQGMGVLLMAIVMVTTNNGEEICSWVLEGPPEDYDLGVSMDRDLAGIRSAVQDALRKEQGNG